MPKRGAGFNPREVKVLLDSIGKYLPIGGTEWEAVFSEHVGHFPDTNRTKEGLKRKFQQLYTTRMPTGDPNISWDVLLAKQLYEEIKKKAEISEGEGSEYSSDEEHEEHVFRGTNEAEPPVTVQDSTARRSKESSNESSNEQKQQVSRS